MSGFTSLHLPTDFTQASHRAFEHALRLALDGKTALRLFHVGKEERPPWSQFPGIRFTLEKWGVLPAGSDKGDVVDLGMKPSKYFVRTDQPVEAILKDLRELKPDLLVMATHARSGVSRIFHPSVCKQVVRGAKLPTLIIPQGCEGFVSDERGECSIKRVLIPISPEVQPGRAVELVTQLLDTLDVKGVKARLIYVGEQHEMPVFDIADSERLLWDSVCRQGEVLAQLEAELESFQPQLLVMTGRGRDSVMDFLLPGKIERLTGNSLCPLLVQNVSAE